MLPNDTHDQRQKTRDGRTERREGAHETVRPRADQSFAREPLTRVGALRRDPHLWSLGVLGYLLVALVLAITVTERQRQAETALDLTLRQMGAELALALSGQTTDWTLGPDRQQRLYQIWTGMGADLPERDRLFAAVTTPAREVLWSAGTGVTLDSRRDLITSTFPVPGAASGRALTVVVGHSAGPPWGGFAGILALFVLFAAVPGVGSYLLLRPLAGPREDSYEDAAYGFPPPRTFDAEDEEEDDWSPERDRPLAEALTLARAGIVQWEEQGPTISVSRSLLALLGQDSADAYLDAEIPREAFRQFLDKGSRDLLERIEYQARVEGHLSFDHTCTLHHHDGRKIPMRMSGVAEPGTARAPARFTAVWTDQSEHDRLAHSAERTATHFKFLLDSLPDGVAVWDAEGYLVAANKPFAKRLGLPGSAMTRALRFPQINAMPDHFERDGHWYRKRVVPLGQDGQIVILSDITRDVELGQKVKTLKARVDAHEQELMTLDDALVRKDEAIARLERTAKDETGRADAAQHAMAEFLANASHELRTPLNAILGFSEMIQQEVFGPLGNEKYKEYVEDIHDSGQSLLNLIQDLLDMSRLASGRVELEPARINVGELLADTLRLARPMAEDKGVELTLDDVRVPSAYADEPAIKRILLHLLSNAVKFTPRGGCVSLSAQADLRMVNIRVADTGVGIESEDLGRLGQPFARTRRAEESGEPGMGLGLAMSRKLAELNHGKLRIESEFGKGTAVTVSLPRRAAVTFTDAGEAPDENDVALARAAARKATARKAS